MTARRAFKKTLISGGFIVAWFSLWTIYGEGNGLELICRNTHDHADISLHARMLDCQDHWYRRHGAQTLMENAAQAKAYLAGLIEAWKQEENTGVKSAIYLAVKTIAEASLPQAGDDDIDFWIAVAGDDKAGFMQVLAIKQLDKIGPKAKKALTTLIKLLENQEISALKVRQAIESIAEGPADKDEIVLWAAALSSDNADAQMLAARQLSRIGEPAKESAGPALLEIWKNEEAPPGLRLEARDALKQMKYTDEDLGGGNQAEE